MMEKQIQKVKDTAKALREVKAKKGIWPWIAGVALVIALIIGVYFLKKALVSNQEELAKLRTKAEQQRIKPAQTKFKASLEANEKKATALRYKAMQQREVANKAVADIKNKEAENAHILEQLEGISSWEELDKLNEKR